MPARAAAGVPETTLVVPALELIDITRTYGTAENQVHALRGVSLTVCPGELVAVMGPSGSGKSTLLTIAGALEIASAGTVRIGGHSVGQLSATERAAVRRRNAGFVFQDYNLIPALTAGENVALPLELDGRRPRAARREARRALMEIDAVELTDRFPDEMSGGQRQRVAIARALVGSRRLILADEPTGALDSVTGELVMRLLRSRIDAGAAGVLVTHDARYAAWADRTIFLRDGQVVQSAATPGGPETLLGVGLQ
ncbi:ABC transporter ATP-binding protein [Rarobacter incanus]